MLVSAISSAARGACLWLGNESNERRREDGDGWRANVSRADGVGRPRSELIAVNADCADGDEVDGLLAAGGVLC